MNVGNSSGISIACSERQALSDYVQVHLCVLGLCIPWFSLSMCKCICIHHLTIHTWSHRYKVNLVSSLPTFNNKIQPHPQKTQNCFVLLTVRRQALVVCTLLSPKAWITDMRMVSITDLVPQGFSVFCINGIFQQVYDTQLTEASQCVLSRVTVVLSPEEPSNHFSLLPHR